VAVPVRAGFARRALLAARKASEIALPATNSGRTLLSDTDASVLLKLENLFLFHTNYPGIL